MEIPVDMWYCPEDGCCIEYKAPLYLYNLVNLMHIVPAVGSQITLYHSCWDNTLEEYLEDPECDGARFDVYIITLIEYYNDSIRICVDECNVE